MEPTLELAYDRCKRKLSQVSKDKTSMDPKPKPTLAPKPRVRVARSEVERQQKFQAILDSAFEVFSDKGFAATRLEDVAARAGVGKGTIYLYVASKQELFEAMISNAFMSSFEVLELAAMQKQFTLEQMISFLIEWFQREVLATRRKEMLWLMLREAKHFPELAKAHHRLIIGRVMKFVQVCAEQALEQGEIAHDEIARFPQLALAPALIGIIWMELFQDIDRLDVEEMLHAYRDLMLRGLKGTSS